MAKAILTAQERAKTRDALIVKLLKFQSAYSCIEAMERQDAMRGSEWSAPMGALICANKALKKECVFLCDEKKKDFTAYHLWAVLAVYECVKAKVEADLGGSTNCVSEALDLLNPEFEECIAALEEFL